MIFMKILRNFFNIKLILIGSRTNKYQHLFGINVALDVLTQFTKKKKKSGNCIGITE